MHDESNINRRLIVKMIGLGCLAAPMIALPQPSVRTIRIVAQRFKYTPDRIELKLGQPVRLELSSLDVLMGFNAPDFKIRSDIVPGKVSYLSFTPQKAGEFGFFCDIYCGAGHTNMIGSFVVS